jgi:hypothetical protein
VTPLAAGATPTVTNVGSSSAATFNFGIPAGATGATGPTGVTSVTNDTNVTGSLSGGVFTLGWTGALAKTRLLSTTVFTDQANTYTAGMKQTFTPSSTTAGLNHAGVTADPSTHVAGDEWFRSDLKQLSYYDGSAVQRVPTSAGSSTPLTGSEWLFGDSVSTGNTTALSVHQVQVYQFQVPSPGWSLTGGVTVYTESTAGDAGHFAFAIYSSTGALIANSQSTTITGAGVSTFRRATWAGTVSLPAGTYYLGYSSDSIATSLYVIADLAGISAGMANAGQTGYGLAMGTCSNASTTTSNVTTLPSTCGTVTALTQFTYPPAAVVN